MIRRWISILVSLVVLAACQPSEQIVVVPTLAVLPSPTITDTPTYTPFPTWTDTPTPTETPSLTPTFTLTPSDTPTETDTPTLTLTPSNTWTPSKTLFPTLTPSNTPTDTPTHTRTPLPTRTFTPVPPTRTPTFTATPLAQIITFGADMTTVTPGASVRLAWSTLADLVRIELLNQNGSLIQSFTALPPVGSLVVITPSNQGRSVQYRLVASRTGTEAGLQGAEASQTISISIVCAVSWFFGDQYVPPGTPCPAAVGAVAQGAFQRFERGVMIYVNANGLNRVYGLQNDSARYLGAVSGWDGTTIDESAAPAGFFRPEQMLNWAYYHTLAPVGTWNSAIGWATTPLDTGFRTVQWEGSIGGSSPFYVDAPNGEIYRFSGGDAGTWIRVR